MIYSQEKSLAVTWQLLNRPRPLLHLHECWEYLLTHRLASGLDSPSKFLMELDDSMRQQASTIRHMVGPEILDQLEVGIRMHMQFPWLDWRQHVLTVMVLIPRGQGNSSPPILKDTVELALKQIPVPREVFKFHRKYAVQLSALALLPGATVSMMATMTRLQRLDIQGKISKLALVEESVRLRSRFRHLKQAQLSTSARSP